MPYIANRGEAFVELNAPDPGSVLISIIDPKRSDVARVPDGYDDILRMRFADYASEASAPKDAVIFTRKHAAQCVRFCRKNRGKNIVAHCAAGISRSGAIADALLQAFPEYEDKGWPRHPNLLVLTLMKRALGLVPIGADDELS
jgi:predicted protein tyrosine phosphatase